MQRCKQSLHLRSTKFLTMATKKKAAKKGAKKGAKKAAKKKR